MLKGTFSILTGVRAVASPTRLCDQVTYVTGLLLSYVKGLGKS